MKKLICYALSLTIVCGCSKESSPPVIPPTIYVAGYTTLIGGNDIPDYWVDNTSTGSFAANTAQSDRTLSTLALDISANGNDIYIVGSNYNNSTNLNVAVLWKNGIPTNLSSGNQPSAYATSVAVTNEHVYVGGATTSLNGLTAQGILWTDGVMSVLNNPNTSASISDVFVNGSDVYACGVEHSQSSTTFLTFASYWKNQVRTVLSDTTKVFSSRATSIMVSGTDVYVSGNYTDPSGKTHAAYWKNGALTILETNSLGSYSLCIFVTGTDVYVGGGYFANNNQQAVYWKNGVMTTLTNAYKAEIGSINVNSGNVYASGSIQSTSSSNSIAVMWKNGIKTALSDSTTTSGVGRGMFLK